jgi:hypothetical protein
VIVTDVEAGCGGRKRCRWTSEPVRTAKACGSGVPTLVLRSRTTVAKEPGHRVSTK